MVVQNERHRDLASRVSEQCQFGLSVGRRKAKSVERGPGARLARRDDGADYGDITVEERSPPGWPRCISRESVDLAFRGPLGDAEEHVRDAGVIRF